MPRSHAAQCRRVNIRMALKSTQEAACAERRGGLRQRHALPVQVSSVTLLLLLHPLSSSVASAAIIQDIPRSPPRHGVRRPPQAWGSATRLLTQRPLHPIQLGAFGITTSCTSTRRAHRPEAANIIRTSAFAQRHMSRSHAAQCQRVNIRMALKPTQEAACAEGFHP